MKVYLVEIGCYSDRKVVGAYSRKDAAEALMAQIKHAVDGCRIHEVDLDRSGVVLAGYQPFDVRIERDGSADVDRCISETDRGHAIFAPTAEDWGKTLRVICWANDEEHAVKIANEVRTRMIAEGTWGK